MHSEPPDPPHSRQQQQQLGAAGWPGASDALLPAAGGGCRISASCNPVSLVKRNQQGQQQQGQQVAQQQAGCIPGQAVSAAMQAASAMADAASPSAARSASREPGSDSDCGWSSSSEGEDEEDDEDQANDDDEEQHGGGPLPPQQCSPGGGLQSPRSPSEMGAGSGDSGSDCGWDDDEGEEEEEEAELDSNPNSDTFSRMWAALSILVQLCFSRLLGVEPSSSKRRRGAEGAVRPPVCSNPNCRGQQGSSAAGAWQLQPKAAAEPRFKARIITARCGPTVKAKCCRCGREQYLSTDAHDICIGDVIWELRGGRREYAVVRSYDSGSPSSAAAPCKDGACWHVQRLGTDLVLPVASHCCGTANYPIHDVEGSTERPFAVFMLQRHSSHTRRFCTRFVSAWSRGEAGVLPRDPAPRLFYQATAEDGYAVLAVPPPNICPSYGSCGCGCRCACLNPWALRGGGNSQQRLYHRTCRQSEQQRQQQQQRVAGGWGCYSPGDYAWLLPPGSAEVDAQTDLVRIQRFFPLIDESQDSLQAPSTAEMWVEYDRYHRLSSVDGFEYVPAGEAGSCPAKQLRRPADLATMPPNMRVRNGGHAAAAAAEDDAGCRAGSVGAAAPDCEGGGDTPSGTDPAATISHSSGPSSGATGSRPGSSPGYECSSAHFRGAGVCQQQQQDQQRCKGSAAASPNREAAGSGGSGQSPTRRIVICDLFSGFGGLSLGLLAALPRSTVGWAVDMFEPALRTYAGCHPGARTLLEDVCSVLEKIRKGEAGYPTPGESGDVWHMLVGGPPCQGFSKANKGDRVAKNRKNVLLCVFLATLEVLQWPYAIIENVAGLLSAGDTVQCVMQCLVSMGYQCSFRLLNAGSFGTAQHRRRVIILVAKHGYPLPHHPTPTHVFEGQGGYCSEGICTVEARKRAALRGVPSVWKHNVEVPTVAPLPPLTAWDVIGDLPAECGKTYGAPASGDAAASYYARLMRGGAQEGTELHNHETWELQAETKERLAALPKEGRPGWEEGEGAWPGPPEHPFRPRRTGNWRDWPQHLIPQSLVDKRDDPQTWGRFARLTWRSHFATCLTCPQLNSDTTSTTVHPVADRPLSVRECARVQGVRDCVRFEGTPAECYKQVGNAVPPPLAEALGREVRKAMWLAEQQQQQRQQPPPQQRQQPQRQQQRPQ